MRAFDQAPPAHTAAPIPPDAPIAGWGAQPVILIERQPVYAYTWDDEDPAVVWDAAGDVYLWDDPATGGDFVDATCDFQALDVEAGNPDDLNLFGSARALISLSNASGAYSIYDESGHLVYAAPGRRLMILARIAGELFWLFAGLIDRWEVNADGSVTVEAHDRFANLAQSRGPFTVGVAGETAGPRIAAIDGFAGGATPRRLDAGTVTLTRQATDQTPLEEIERVALSDGGLVYTDADGTLLYRDRLWPAGRADQPAVDVFTDNVCDGPITVWDAELSTVDDWVVTTATLANVAGLTATATTTDPLLLAGAPFPLTHPDPDLWTTQAEGDTLAGALVDFYAKASVGIRSMSLHLLDPTRDLWRTGIDKRLGDRIRFQHDYVAAGGGTGTFDVTLIVTTVTHQVTPESWVVSFATSPAVDATPVQRWDRTLWLWDDADARWDY